MAEIQRSFTQHCAAAAKTTGGNRHSHQGFPRGSHRSRPQPDTGSKHALVGLQGQPFLGSAWPANLSRIVRVESLCRMLLVYPTWTNLKCVFGILSALDSENFRKVLNFMICRATLGIHKYFTNPVLTERPLPPSSEQIQLLPPEYNGLWGFTARDWG